MAAWKKICKTTEIPEGVIKGFSVDGKSIAVANIGGEFFAFDGVCTHAECDLASGSLDDHKVLCWCHGSEFDVRTGKVMASPAEKPLTTYPVKSEGENLLAEV